MTCNCFAQFSEEDSGFCVYRPVLMCAAPIEDQSLRVFFPTKSLLWPAMFCCFCFHDLRKYNCSWAWITQCEWCGAGAKVTRCAEFDLSNLQAFWFSRLKIIWKLHLSSFIWSRFILRVVDANFSQNTIFALCGTFNWHFNRNRLVVWFILAYPLVYSFPFLLLTKLGHLTLEDYQIWSVKSALANEFLNLLFQVRLEEI